MARTEGQRNQNSASYWNTLEASKQVSIKRQWIATRDGRTRDRHIELDGKTVGVDEPFRIDGMIAMFPGDFGVPEMDINCRCSVIDIVDNLDPQVQRVRNPITGKNEIASFYGYDEYRRIYG